MPEVAMHWEHQFKHKEEMIRMEELNAARAELNKTTEEKPVTQKMFRVV